MARRKQAEVRDGSTSKPSDRNIRAIAEIERRSLHDRSPADRLSDAITRATGSAAFATGNALFFLAWMVVNTIHLGGFERLDPFPFNFLTLVVSLEAIFLAIFVLMSQNRMMLEADKRAHLDLQVDLLAEQELTTIAQMLRALCSKLQVEVPVPEEKMGQLLHETDVHKLADALEDRLPTK